MLAKVAGLMALVVAAASGSKGKEATTREDGRVRRITLDDEGAVRAFEVRMGAPGDVTTVDFPEEIKSAPTCASCTGPSKPGDALYVLRAEVGDRYLMVWPSDSARRWAAAGERTVVPVVVPLKHGVVTLVLKRVESSRADHRVVFVGPSRQVENEYLRIERQELAATEAARVKAAVMAKLQELFSGPHKCERKRGRTRNNDVVLEVNEMCAFGKYVVVGFTVENRGRPPLESGKVVVTRGSERSEVSLGLPMGLGELRTGVVVLPLPEAMDWRGSYEVALYESGDKGRVVTVSGEEL